MLVADCVQHPYIEPPGGIRDVRFNPTEQIMRMKSPGGAFCLTLYFQETGQSLFLFSLYPPPGKDAEEDSFASRVISSTGLLA